MKNTNQFIRKIINFINKKLAIFLIVLLLFGFFINFLFIYLLLIIIFYKFYFQKKKIIFLIISNIFISFFLVDIFYFYYVPKSDYRIESNVEYEINKKYGYHPIKNFNFKETVFFKEKIIKENNYSINEFGHRNLYNKLKNLDKCIVLHGGSITFGQSLNDDETLHFYLKDIFKDTYNIYNFAFNGYGPHQFLSKLKNNYLDEIKNCRYIIVIYQFMYNHIGTTAGKRSWGDKSPRYVLKNNELIQKGFFSDYPYKIIMKTRKNFRNSKILSLLYNVNKVDEKDKKIFLSILEEIVIEIKNKFNKSEFIYIIRNNPNFDTHEIYNFLWKSKYIIIDDLKLNEKIEKNMIPGDNHPTKEYNVIVAKELEKKIKFD